MEYKAMGTYDTGAALVLLVLHLVGIYANIHLALYLKKHWRHLGYLKIIILLCVSANTLALFFDLHKPLNSILQSHKQAPHWIFGRFVCEVLPPASKLPLVASVISWSVLVHSYHDMRLGNGPLTRFETEAVVFLVWAMAAILTAPMLGGTQLLAYDSEFRAELCLTVWYTNRLARMSSAWLIVLQYTIPVASIASCVAKIILRPGNRMKVPYWYPFVVCFINTLSVMGVFAVMYYIPLQVDEWPTLDPHLILEILGQFALSVCLVAPLILLTLVKYELNEAEPCLIVKQVAEEKFQTEKLISTVSKIV